VSKLKTNTEQKVYFWCSSLKHNMKTKIIHKKLFAAIDSCKGVKGLRVKAA